MLKITHVVVERVQFLMGYLTKASHSGLAGFFIGQLTTWKLTSLELEVRRARQSIKEMEITVFYNLILEMIFCHFFRILFLRKKTLDPAHDHKLKNTQRCEYREGGTFGGHVRSFLPYSLHSHPAGAM